ncbi:MAG: DEAD/DEAH box helicase, partial [Candidatus Binatia bacterium]
MKARYVLGLTATPQRRDGHQPILEMQLGPVRFSVDAKSQSTARPFAHTLIVRETRFRLRGGQEQAGIQEIYRALASDEERNRLILDDVIQAVAEGRSPILLTERRDHLEYFAEKLRGFARNLVVLRGGMTAKKRRDSGIHLAEVPDDAERLVLATGRYLGEGFDDARLDTLFLAMPISWKGTLVQYAGRLHRLHPRKTEVRIFDYVDREVPMLARMFEKRLRTFRAIGYARGEAPLRRGGRRTRCRVQSGGATALRRFDVRLRAAQAGALTPRNAGHSLAGFSPRELKEPRLSTKNLARTVIEGGRSGWSRWAARHETRRERRKVKHLLHGDRDHENVSFPRRGAFELSQNDRVNPAIRWLASNCGRPWRKVYSELVAKFDTR